MTQRFEPTWDDYLRELDTYAEARSSELVEGALKRVRRHVDPARAAAARHLAGGADVPVALLGLAGAAATTSFLLNPMSWSGIKRLLAPRRAGPSGASYIDRFGTRPRWEPLVKQERALDPDDDHRVVTLGLLALSEGTIRQLVFDGSEPVVEGVLSHAETSRRYLERVLQNDRRLTWTSLAVWLRALESAVTREDAAVVAWVCERFSTPSIRGSDVLFALKDLRNEIAHDQLAHVSRTVHDDAAHALLGASLAEWWRSAPPMSLAPVTHLLRARRAG